MLVSKRMRGRHFLVMTTCAVVFLLASGAQADYKKNYLQGLRAYDFKKWREAVICFSACIDEQPREGGDPIRGPGTEYVTYLPHYYVGRALYELGRYDDALFAWTESETQGEISKKRNKRELNSLRRLKGSLPTEVLPGDIARVSGDFERVRTAVGEASTRPWVSDDPQFATVSKALANASENLAKAQSDRSFAAVERASVALQEARIALGAVVERSLARQAESERLAREQFASAARERRRGEYRGAAESIRRGECSEGAVAILRGFVEGGADDLRAAIPDESPETLLALGHFNCGDLDRAEQALEIARRVVGVPEVTASKLTTKLGDARRQQEFKRRLDDAKTQLAAGGCRPGATSLLEALLASRAGAPPLPTTTDPLNVLLAQSKLRCLDLEGTAEALKSATAASENPERIAAVLSEYRVEADRFEEARRREALLARYRDAAMRVEQPACDPSAVQTLESLLSSGANDALLREFAPNLTLAKAHLKCGSLERARADVDRAGRLAEGTSTSVAELRGQVDGAEQARAKMRQGLEWMTGALAASAKIDLGSCDRSSLADFEGFLPRWKDAVSRGEALPMGAIDPYLTLARGYRACEESAATQKYLALVRDDQLSGRDVVGRLNAWVEATKAPQSYQMSEALVVGMTTYVHKDAWRDLPEVESDLEAVVPLLESQQFQVTTLRNPTATKLREALEGFFVKGRNTNSRLLFYYSGHGATRSTQLKVRLGYIVPSDGFPEDARDLGYLRSMVTMDDFERYAKETDAKHVAFFFDSCFSGTIFDATKSRVHRGPRTEAGMKEVVDNSARLFITAGDAGQEPPPESMFRRAVVDALNGRADENDDGVVLGSEVGNYVAHHGTTRSTEPQWGMMEKYGFDRGDVLFRRLPLKGGQDQDPTISEARSKVEAELRVWRLAEESEDRATLSRYLESYPDGRFNALARWAMGQLPPSVDGWTTVSRVDDLGRPR